MTVTRRGTIVHVDVMDDGQTGLPHWREATGEDEGGRGFQLVNEIAVLIRPGRPEPGLVRAWSEPVQCSIGRVV